MTARKPPTADPHTADDAAELRTVADWFDFYDADERFTGDRSVQRDLRRIAAELVRMRDELAAFNGVTPDDVRTALAAGQAAVMLYEAAAAKLAAVEALAEHAAKVSPSPSMTVYVGDLERALGRRTDPVHGKVGQNDAQVNP